MITSQYSPGEWQVTDDAENTIFGYVSQTGNLFNAFGRKLHTGKGGMRQSLGSFSTVEDAVKAIASDYQIPNHGA